MIGGRIVMEVIGIGEGVGTKLMEYDITMVGR